MIICLAGTFAETRNTNIIEEVPFVLESYYYIKPWQYDLIHKARFFLLDSGAFTFFNNGKTRDWDKYLEDYANFIVEHDVKYFFELDIDDIVGYDNVKKMRNKLEKLTNRKCIPVWHISRGIDEFKTMCEEYGYVAIGGLVGKSARSPKQRLLEKNFPWFIQYAHSHGAKIHCLGYTKVSDLTRTHFDSVDSTRWNCSRFGRLEYFDGHTMRSIDRRKEGKRLVHREKQDVVKFTLSEWIKFQKYAETHL